jgi:NTP pyrophosphatase (non-canonical NTP hydrolase)
MTGNKPESDAGKSRLAPRHGAGEGTAGAAASSPLTLRDAQRLVDEWMRARGWAYWHPLSQLARLTEELGELARLVNHLFGEKPKKLDEPAQELALELADLLYTMICLANSQGIDLQAGLEQVLAKYGARDAERYPPA